MMLVDPEVGPGIKEGMWQEGREGKGDNEGNSERKKQI
jgi:hypothetical protein